MISATISIANFWEFYSAFIFAQKLQKNSQNMSQGVNGAMNGNAPHHHIDAAHENAEAGGLEEDIGTFLFSSESVGEGHPGMCSHKNDQTLELSGVMFYHILSVHFCS